VIYGLLERGIGRIVVANRTTGRAEALRQRFGERVYVMAWEALDQRLGEAALLVNTTTLGMIGQPDLAVNVGSLPGHAIVADLVYVPLRTALLRNARARGLRVADGLGMLLHQAVGGFTLWFGKKPQVTPELRRLLDADIDPSTATRPGIT
jgi:shikimate dehydrogenase